MRAILQLFLLVSASTLTLWGQTTPYIFYRGVFNAASFTPAGLPGAAIARGSIFTIFGRNLGPAMPVTASFPIGMVLSGTALEVCVGPNCTAVLPLFVSSSQINAILPSNAPLGRVNLRARVGGVNSNWLTIDTLEASPGLFAINAAGFGPGIVQNFVSPTEAPNNSLGNTARPGQSLILYGTGLGAITAPDNQPAPAGNVGRVEVLVGEQVVAPDYAGRTPVFAGLDQINFTVPAGTPTGCYVPLRVRSNGRVTSNTVTIAIGPRAGERCDDEHNPLSGPVSLGRRVAAILPQRLENQADVDPYAPFNFLQEWLVARIAQPAPNDFAFSPLSLPPPGACSAYTQSGNWIDQGFQMPVVGDPASALRLRIGAAQSREISPAPFNVMSHLANLTYKLTSTARQFFSSPMVSVNAEGIEGQFPTARALSLSNAAALRSVSRAQALTVSWSGTTSEDRALVTLAAYDEAQNASALLACLARAGENSLTIPVALLETLPVTPRQLGRYGAVLGLGRFPVRPATLRAPGYDVAIGALGVWTMQNIWIEGGAR
ncbi:MAG: hypothetical protein NW208_13155 [Bryobacter sp.]|nr:hypothetical protein [Bryobacter sp.]